ncbi:helicase HerA-like domain-containing protein [Lutibaculum baratangense]|uniref:ATPase n=1 Tax=Lutibaculum baratangense AMV1 TaxID=631454 RepID=V4QSH8_9HYPH|nr:helicase HerA-like domain-containing protein [Lutibaculum baratangense]ESR22737.1 ATPase [Lutibaculum baratangense AMV1]
MTATDTIFIGAGAEPQHMELRFANRHGLVTGATGTGKTVTLQVLAEQFSRAGVPVFCADVKGDLSGVAVAGEPKGFLSERAEMIGLADLAFEGSPVVFWDLFGREGHPLRTTISDMGPLLLSRLLDCTDAQEGAINLAFHLADEEGLLLLDMNDLEALLSLVEERSAEGSLRQGGVSRATTAAIRRRLLVLRQQGGESLFGEPALDIRDLMRVDRSGRGYVNVLSAGTLMQAPRLYATFLLWLMSELFEELPEVGDPDRPKLVFFFDEAHLLFDEAPKALLEKVEQVVRLIRSKGVGIYFVTQNPADVPDTVLAQLGNRFQHALRAYTPREQKAVRVAAETFRPNPAFDTEEAITTLGVGEALVSTLQDKGVPSVVERTLVRPPSSRMGPITEAERQAVMADSPVRGIYDRPVDRESAHEILSRRAEEKLKAAEAAKQEQAAARRGGGSIFDLGGGSGRQTVAEAAVKSLTRTVASTIGREIVRGILGSLRRR